MSSNTKGLSRIEHFLTVHIRKFLKEKFTEDQIRYMSFTLSLLTCLVDANVTVFSLFTTSMINELGYTQIDINIISGYMLVGLYLTLPVLGYLADAHGPVLLAIIGGLLTPGYYLASIIFRNRIKGTYLMATIFFFIGMGTSSSYFSSLLTCARVFPDRKGLGISLPVSFYGVSTFLLAWILNFKVFKNDEGGNIDVEKVFKFLSLLYLIVFFVNWISSVVVSIEKEIIFAKLFKEEEEEAAESGNIRNFDENDRLLENLQGETIEEVGLINGGGIIKEEIHEDKFKKFLKDPSMKLVIISLFCISGPLEIFISNLGSIVKEVFQGDETDISKQISIFSITSTISRLSIGLINEKYSSIKNNVTIIYFAMIITIVGFQMIYINKILNFDIISCLIGIGYGTIFTIYPTLTANIWGIEMLGSTWGLFLSAPAIGSIVFGMIYAIGFDKVGVFNIFGMMSLVVLGGGVSTIWIGHHRYWSSSI